MENKSIFYSSSLIFGSLLALSLLFSNADLEQSNQASIDKLYAEIVELRSNITSLEQKVTAKMDNSNDIMMGEIRLFAGNFAPEGWAFCNGNTLPISSYSALFSILGTTYGGDGKTTFALPDLQGRTPLGVGEGTGLEKVMLGWKIDQEKIMATNDKTASANTSISVRNPCLGLHYIIAIEGYYPQRN